MLHRKDEDVVKAIMNHREVKEKVRSDVERHSLKYQLGNEEPSLRFNYDLNFWVFSIPLDMVQLVLITFSKPIGSEDKKKFEDGVKNVFKTIFQT